MKDGILKLVGKNDSLRLVAGEQEAANLALNKNGFYPIKVVDSDSSLESTVLGLSDETAEFLLSKLKNENQSADVIQLNEFKNRI